MAKIDVYRLKRPALRSETRTFGNGMTLSLRKLGVIESHAKDELVDDYVQRWVRGVPVLNPDGSMVMDPETGRPELEIEPFPAVQTEDGRMETVELNERVIRVAATLEAMQVQDSDDRYTAEEFLVLGATDGETWQEIVAWATGIQNGDAPGKKLLPESGAQPSTSASGEASDTPN